MEKQQQVLYHYTSIQNLALILKHKSIKFNKLTNLDDLDEGNNIRTKAWAQYRYVSCWTSEERESIPMWTMYSQDMRGVRLELPTDLFRHNHYIESEQYSFYRILDHFQPGQSDYKDRFPELSNSKKIRISNEEEPFQLELYKVKYTDSLNRVFPNFIQCNKSGQATVSIHKLGKYKRMEWRFQKEWRYAMNFFPKELFDMTPFTGKKANLQMQQFFRGPSLGAPDAIFYELKPEILEKLKVVYGPHVSAGDIEIINLILSKYAPKAGKRESSLEGVIRPHSR